MKRTNSTTTGVEAHLRAARELLGPEAADEDVYQLALRAREDYLDSARLPITDNPG